MTPEEKELLRETAELTKENHKILKSMQRNARIASFFRAIYWIFIIGSAVGAYYFIQPYIEALGSSYSSLKDNLSNISELTTKLPALPDWLNKK